MMGFLDNIVRTQAQKEVVSPEDIYEEVFGGMEAGEFKDFQAEQREQYHQEAVKGQAAGQLGEDAKIAVIPEGPLVIPIF